MCWIIFYDKVHQQSSEGVYSYNEFDNANQWMSQLNDSLGKSVPWSQENILQIEVHVAQFFVKFYWTALYVYMVIRSVLTKLLSHMLAWPMNLMHSTSLRSMCDDPCVHDEDMKGWPWPNKIFKLIKVNFFNFENSAITQALLYTSNFIIHY